MTENHPIVPEFVIEGLWADYAIDGPLFQKHFGHLTADQQSELHHELMACLEADVEEAIESAFKGKKPSDNPTYVGTAGPPLAGKSSTLYQAMEKPEYKNAVFADPDQAAAIYHMPRTKQLIGNRGRARGFVPHGRTAEENNAIEYEILRPASNVISNGIINKAVAERYDIAHGTTATGGHMANFYKTLKEHGYKIDLLVCADEIETSIASEHLRRTSDGIHQATDEDVKTKAEMFIDTMPIYFEHADRITLHWRDSPETGPVEAARFEKGAFEPEILDEEAFTSFVAHYGEKSDREFGEMQQIYADNFAARRDADIDVDDNL